MNIGIYGGTFDPPHRGHIAAAKAAVSALHLDRLLLKLVHLSGNAKAILIRIVI